MRAHRAIRRVVARDDRRLGRCSRSLARAVHRDYATRDPNPHAIAVGVATNEREQWQAVKRGELPFVDGNSFFIQFDRALYAELFG
jgi:hypothetical protein